MDCRKKVAVSVIWIFPRGIDGLSQNPKAERDHPWSLTTDVLGMKL